MSVEELTTEMSISIWGALGKYGWCVVVACVGWAVFTMIAIPVISVLVGVGMRMMNVQKKGPKLTV
jgi:hypothetical protein